MNVRVSRRKKIKKKPIKKMLNLYPSKMTNIVIVGDKEIKRHVGQMEKTFSLAIRFANPDEIDEFVNTRTIAVVVDEKKVGSKAKKYLKSLLTEYHLLPIFYLSRVIRPSSFYTSLYEQGLQGVINWPTEAKILQDLIIEAVEPSSRAIGKNKKDEKLLKTVKSHLLLSGSYKSIKVKVIEGFAFLEGSVQSLQDKKLLESDVGKVLGIKKAIVRRVKIKNTQKATDRELERKIKMYIGHILGDKKRSISIKAKNRVVTLVGATAHHADVLDIEDFAMRQPGVQEVIRNIKYSTAVMSKNVKKAKELESKIGNLFNGVKHIAITIHGEIAEVSGTVKIKADKSLVEKYLLQTLTVKKVVNKLFVSGGR
jgi:osmotically-inducible protein OsmY